jgi:ferredoxin-nitrite reductase
MSLIPDTIAGAPITTDQEQYLDGFFSGMRNRGLSFAAAEPKAGPEPLAKIEKLTPEELIKREKHPFDALEDLRTQAALGIQPEKKDIFRFKWNGLFWLAPVHEGYMCRLRIPGGVIRADQLRELANISDDLASGYLQLTTRNNVQIRIIAPGDTMELLRRIQNCGLQSRGSGADNLRNFTSNPTSGFDPHELIDVLPYVRELAHLVVNSTEFYDLPRKFNISFDSGGLVGVAEDTNDIGMRAVRMNGEVYFRILLGGVTGHQEFAEDCGYLCRPEHAVEVCLALTRVWIKHGRRDQRGKARLIYLLKEWGHQKYIVETQKLLPFPLIPFESSRLDTNAKPKTAHPHVGLYPQKQANRFSLGIYIPVGLMPSEQARAIAHVAETYGAGELRLTVFQNLIIPHLPGDRLAAAQADLAAAGLGWEASYIRGGAAACTGNRYCKFANSDTKSHTIELVDHLEARLTLDQPINIHTTGCPHSCAQHYIGDIGLLACKVAVEGKSELVEGYHVFVGGGFGEDKKRLGRQLLKGVPAGADLHEKIERLLRGYLSQRAPGESFLEYTSRTSLDDLMSLIVSRTAN